jgi:hypothetical protein
MVNRKIVLTHVLAFAVGVLLTLLLASRFHGARYVPFDAARTRILDTRNGRVYAQGEYGKWIIEVERVGK